MVKEVFSDELAETISRAKLGDWTIDSAMNNQWTEFEKNPPDTLDFSGWTRKLPVTSNSICNLIVQAAIQQYGLSSQSEAVKKLSRYGLPIVFSEWEPQVMDIKQFSEAAVCFSKYSKQNPNLINLFEDKQQIKIKAGRSGSSQSQWRVIWYQKLLIKEMSDTLGICQSDILLRVIFEAGSALSLKEQKPNIEKAISCIDRDIKTHVRDLKQPVYGALLTGLLGDCHREFVKKCRSDFPRVWDDLQRANSVVAEEKYSQKIQTI